MRASITRPGVQRRGARRVFARIARMPAENGNRGTAPGRPVIDDGRRALCRALRERSQLLSRGTRLPFMAGEGFIQTGGRSIGLLVPFQREKLRDDSVSSLQDSFKVARVVCQCFISIISEFFSIFCFL